MTTYSMAQQSDSVTQDKSVQTDPQNMYAPFMIIPEITFAAIQNDAGYYDDDGDEDYEEEHEEDEDDTFDQIYEEEARQELNDLDQTLETEESHEEPRGRTMSRRCDKRTLKRCYRKEDYRYYQGLNAKRQKVIDDIERKIFTCNEVQIPQRFRILESDMDLNLKSLALSKVNQLSTMDPSSGEYHKISNWIEQLSKLPIGKYKELPISMSSEVTEITQFLENVKVRLDSAVYGHTDTKGQIIRLLAKWISNKDSKGLVIGLQGPAGVGKTSIAMEICSSLNLPFGFMSLSGISTSEMLKGFQYTYEGSRHGAIADVLMKAKFMNPILFFDELDKVSTTKAGEEVSNTLIHITDHSQNHKFQDRYFGDIDLDLSKCLIIFSYNNEALINPILRDRLVRINVEGYTTGDKTKILKNFLLPKALNEYAFTEKDVCIDDATVSYLIDNVEKEAGVRNLKRGLEEIISQLNLHRLLQKEITNGVLVTFPFEIKKELVDKFVKQKPQKSDVMNMMYI